MSYYIAPSLLAADFLNLSRDMEMINTSQADYLHVDIMDGVFVPAISFGQNIVSQVHSICKKELDVHLMIVNPDRYIEEFVQAGASIVTVHYEACTHLHRTIQLIKSTGAKAGVALNPHTPVEMLYDVLEDIDLALVMSVNPGFGGQKFIYNSLNKIKKLSTEIKSRNLQCKIEVDGGVGLQNAESILQAGADILVAGNAVFSSDNPLNTIKSLKEVYTFSV